MKRGYFYNWEVPVPCTNDPKYAEKLRRGYHQRVLLDGRDVGCVYSCVTGPNGWVKVDALDEGGELVIRSREITKITLYGDVTYICEE